MWECGGQVTDGTESAKVGPRLEDPLGLGGRSRGKTDVDGGVCGFDGLTLRELPTNGLSSSSKVGGGHLYQWTVGSWSVLFTVVPPGPRTAPGS